jgi:hypothetical protein
MFPIEQAPTQLGSIDAQRIAYHLKAKCFAAIAVGHNPLVGVNEKAAGVRCGGHRATLINIDGVGQESQHQPLLAEEFTSAAEVVILAGQNQVGGVVNSRSLRNGAKS